MLTDHAWRLKYTPEDGDLVRLFYVPALEDAERYDRLTGYFNAGALALAARGIEGLVRNGGRMRLVVGCTLDPAEVEAIERGEALRERVERRLADLPLAPPDPAAADALELLAWMVAGGHLDVKVAVPCDAGGKPTPDGALFHEKAGIVEDRAGNRIAWTGSLNETAAGWRRNWESISVYTSWGPEPERVDGEERNFARLWAGRAARVIVLDVPEAARRDLMRFLPEDLPARLRGSAGAGRPGPGEGGVRNPAAPAPAPDAPPGPAPGPALGPGAAPETPARPPPIDRRSLVWAFLRDAPAREGGGAARVGEATAAVTPWPHQIRAFERLYSRWPPKLLIADEVGLGKTIQAGLLLRQAWLAGRARRILVLAPKALLAQWQIELREKFNLNWPIYDGRRLVRYPSPALRGGGHGHGHGHAHEREAGRSEWHREPAVIASSHLMRRRDRAAALLEEAAPWDLVVLDEAHHARRRAAGAAQEGGPNALLALMRALRERTQGLVLLTATPMQVHPVEVWDLLDLLGLPPEWTAEAFLQFFEDVEHPNPPPEAMERMARLFRAVERDRGAVAGEAAARLTGLSPLRAGKVLRALRDSASIPRRQLETAERRAALAVMRGHTPIRHLVSRHTRELLRRYFEAGMLTTPVAKRRVEDRFIEMTATERGLYEAVEDYIASTYDQASAAERSAVGFVMTIYRRRLASSFRSLRATLERRLDTIGRGGGGGSGGGGGAPLLSLDEDEDAPDDEAADEAPDAEELAEIERRALAAEERADVERLLDRIRACPPDSKIAALKETLAALREEGFEQAMVFTQYTDTMDFLRDELHGDGELRLMCFSGRGGEIPAGGGGGGAWRGIGRDDTKRRFRLGEADVLLCTDAAAEGLDFQFCGALVNYDMPWNPMRVEQRIGRIDRLGQRRPVIRVVNLHYEGTVETDVYRALRSRIGLFESVVGRLQPILAQLPRAISDAVLSGRGGGAGEGGDGGGGCGKGAAAGSERAPAARGRADLADAVERQAHEAESGGGFDLDAALGEELALPDRPPPLVTLDDLDRIIASPSLMPPGTEIEPLGHRGYGLRAPGMREALRVTTDPAYYEEHAESVELWSPGSPLFRPPELPGSGGELAPGATLREVLDR